MFRSALKSETLNSDSLQVCVDKNRYLKKDQSTQKKKIINNQSFTEYPRTSLNSFQFKLGSKTVFVIQK